MAKTAVLELLEPLILILRKNMSDRKILKFPHCALDAKVAVIYRKNGFDITPNPMFVVGSENVPPSSSRNSTPSPASMVTNNIATNIRTRHESIPSSTNAINENEKETGANNLHKAGSLISMTSQVG